MTATRELLETLVDRTELKALADAKKEKAVTSKKTDLNSDDFISHKNGPYYDINFSSLTVDQLKACLRSLSDQMQATIDLNCQDADKFATVIEWVKNGKTPPSLTINFDNLHISNDKFIELTETVKEIKNVEFTFKNLHITPNAPVFSLQQAKDNVSQIPILPPGDPIGTTCTIM